MAVKREKKIHVFKKGSKKLYLAYCSRKQALKLRI
jgi:hypothetical protein